MELKKERKMKKENYIIAEISGTQIILETGKKVKVPRLDLDEGAKYVANKILFYSNNGDVKIGTPYIKDFSVETIVSEHKRDDKVIVFKKKRRKGYMVKNGHKQPFTVLEVGDFKTKSAKKTVVKESAEQKDKTEAKKE